MPVTFKDQITNGSTHLQIRSYVDLAQLCAHG